MKMNEQSALKTAEFLLQIKAIKLNVTNPFTWASGIKSPIYCDNRRTLSFPKVRTYIRQEFARIINEEFMPVDVIAGVATGGIAIGALAAQELGLPFAYVRSSEKKHGLANVIEGVIEPGQSVVVIEDLVSTGQSSLAVVQSLKEAGANVKGMVAIFTYELQKAVKSFEKEQVTLYTLTNYTTLIKQAIASEYVTENDLDTLASWRIAPEKWGI
jgi:orotate phosphoribosyltransferase